MLLCRAGTEAAQCIVWEYRRASGLLPLSRNAALLRMLNIPAVKSSCGRSPDVDGGSGRGRLERGRSNQVRSGEGQVEVRSSRTLEEPWNAFWKCAFKTTPTPVRKGAATAAVAKKKEGFARQTLRAISPSVLSIYIHLTQTPRSHRFWHSNHIIAATATACPSVLLKGSARSQIPHERSPNFTPHLSQAGHPSRRPSPGIAHYWHSGCGVRISRQRLGRESGSLVESGQPLARNPSATSPLTHNTTHLQTMAEDEEQRQSDPAVPSRPAIHYGGHDRFELELEVSPSLFRRSQ